MTVDIFNLVRSQNMFSWLYNYLFCICKYLFWLQKRFIYVLLFWYLFQYLNWWFKSIIWTHTHNLAKEIAITVRIQMLNNMVLKRIRYKIWFNMPVVHHYIYVLIYQTINQYLLVKMVIILWEENNRKLKQKMHKLFPVLNSRVLISWWQWMIDILFELQSFGPVCDREFYWGTVTHWRDELRSIIYVTIS